jgi:hypothetical protein
MTIPLRAAEGLVPASLSRFPDGYLVSPPGDRGASQNWVIGASGRPREGVGGERVLGALLAPPYTERRARTTTFATTSPTQNGTSGLSEYPRT